MVVGSVSKMLRLNSLRYFDQTSTIDFLIDVDHDNGTDSGGTPDIK